LSTTFKNTTTESKSNQLTVKIQQCHQTICVTEIASDSDVLQAISPQPIVSVVRGYWS